MTCRVFIELRKTCFDIFWWKLTIWYGSFIYWQRLHLLLPLKFQHVKLYKLSERKVVLSIPYRRSLWHSRVPGGGGGNGQAVPTPRLGKYSWRCHKNFTPAIITTMLIKIATNRLRPASGSGRLMRRLYDVTLYALSLAPSPNSVCFYRYTFSSNLCFYFCLIVLVAFWKCCLIVNDYHGRETNE